MTLTTPQLSKLRLVDRCSCFVRGLSKLFPVGSRTGQNSFFSRFGRIRVIRRFEQKDAMQVLVRFVDEQSALRAICYFNANSPNSAGHGYHRYCVSFLDPMRGYRCKRRMCPHKHEWADPRDTLASPKTKSEHRIFQLNMYINGIFDGKGQKGRLAAEGWLSAMDAVVDAVGEIVDFVIRSDNESSNSSGTNY